MKRHPYSKIYLDDVRTKLGYMCQFAYDGYGLSLEELFKKFEDSPFAKGIENALPYYMVHFEGSGIMRELYPDRKCTVKQVGYGTEFWIGWAMAYLQWYSNLSFKELFSIVDADRFYCMYPAYHEMSDTHLKEFATKFLIKKGK